MRLIITVEYAGQRIDNYLIAQVKGIPRSRIYKALRSGEIRVNSRRIKPPYRLQEGDQVRLPPWRPEATPTRQTPLHLQKLLQEAVVYEAPGWMILNKPTGLAVHGGTEVSSTVIDTLRAAKPGWQKAELVHRLDKATSGCLLVAKKHSALRALQAQFREAEGVEKLYLALVKGRLAKRQTVDVPLIKNHLQGGERVVQVSAEGKTALSIFEPLQHFSLATLVLVRLKTGRTHQIRVHGAHIGHPIAGDEKYGDKEFNRRMKDAGLKRLFLHSAGLRFQDPASGAPFGLCIPLEKVLQAFLRTLTEKLAKAKLRGS